MRYKNDEFFNIIDDLLESDTVNNLKFYRHHYGSNRFDHSMSVAYYSYLVCKFLHLDYKSASRAGMLHDLFLYDCESKVTRPKFHIWNHPKIALQNARKLFDLNDKECDIILKHMWPITFFAPKYFESFIVASIDKYCAFIEWSNYCKNILLYLYISYFYI